MVRGSHTHTAIQHHGSRSTQARDDVRDGMNATFALESFMVRFITSPIEPRAACRIRCVSVSVPLACSMGVHLPGERWEEGLVVTTRD